VHQLAVEELVDEQDDVEELESSRPTVIVHEPSATPPPTHPRATQHHACAEPMRHTQSAPGEVPR
jgi:hypothetical protein